MLKVRELFPELCSIFRHAVKCLAHFQDKENEVFVVG
jgi:hypothetical protein